MTGAEIAALRTSLDLSTAELAKALNVTPLTMARWEHGGAAGGLADQILRGIDNAVRAEPGRGPEFGRRLALGVGAFLYYGLREFINGKGAAILGPVSASETR